MTPALALALITFTLTPDGVVALGLLAVLLVAGPIALTSPGMRRAIWGSR